MVKTFRKIRINKVIDSLESELTLIGGAFIEDLLPKKIEEAVSNIKNAGIKIWINSIWASLCDGHDDDRAVELGEPDESWGWILDRGGTVIQTDRPYDLLQYLKNNKRHKLK